MIIPKSFTSPCDVCDAFGPHLHGGAVISRGATGRWCEVLWLCSKCVSLETITPALEAAEYILSLGGPNWPDFAYPDNLSPRSTRMNLPLSACNDILFRTNLQVAIDRSTSMAKAFRNLQDLSAQVAEALPPEHRNAANLIMAFAMLVRAGDSLSILETFADLTDGIPPFTEGEANPDVEALFP